MSYGFMLFKVAAGVRSPDDLSEETTHLLDPGAEIRARLTSLYPRIDWHRSEVERMIFGSLDGEDGWYEFVLYEDADKSFSINTSLQAETRWLVEDICEALGLVAFDKQAYTLIGV